MRLEELHESAGGRMDRLKKAFMNAYKKLTAEKPDSELENNDLLTRRLDKAKQAFNDAVKNNDDAAVEKILAQLGSISKK